jgi:hypothetical protein
MAFTSAQFRTELHRIFANAVQERHESVVINAGDLHTRMGDYPDPKEHRMNALCGVMRAEYSPANGDSILSQPPEGKGANLTIKYILPRR